jgi:hypothetical protein
MATTAVKNSISLFEFTMATDRSTTQELHPTALKGSSNMSSAPWSGATDEVGPTSSLLDGVARGSNDSTSPVEPQHYSYHPAAAAPYAQPGYPIYSQQYQQFVFLHQQQQYYHAQQSPRSSTKYYDSFSRSRSQPPPYRSSAGVSEQQPLLYSSSQQLPQQMAETQQQGPMYAYQYQNPVQQQHHFNPYYSYPMQPAPPPLPRASPRSSVTNAPSPNAAESRRRGSSSSSSLVAGTGTIRGTPPSPLATPGSPHASSREKDANFGSKTPPAPKTPDSLDGPSDYTSLRCSTLSDDSSGASGYSQSSVVFLQNDGSIPTTAEDIERQFMQKISASNGPSQATQPHQLPVDGKRHQRQAMFYGSTDSTMNEEVVSHGQPLLRSVSFSSLVTEKLGSSQLPSQQQGLPPKPLSNNTSAGRINSSHRRAASDQPIGGFAKGARAAGVTPTLSFSPRSRPPKPSASPTVSRKPSTDSLSFGSYHGPVSTASIQSNLPRKPHPHRRSLSRASSVQSGDVSVTSMASHTSIRSDIFHSTLFRGAYEREVIPCFPCSVSPELTNTACCRNLRCRGQWTDTAESSSRMYTHCC